MDRPVKTTLVAVLASATLAGVVVVLAGGPKNPPTELYVRTDPPGARISVDGEAMGTSPALIEVEPGVYEIVVKLAGHDPEREKVAVPATEITRVIFELKKRAEGAGGTAPRGPDSTGRRRPLPDEAANSVRLPEPMGLDLASGETLAFSGGALRDPAVFTRLDQGDLVNVDGFHCIRGAKAKCLEDENFPAVKVHADNKEITSYKLPKIPCRLLVTTGEGRRFHVTVAAIHQDGAIDLEYRPADVAVVPQAGILGTGLSKGPVPSQVDQALNIIERDYLQDVEDGELTAAAIQGMIGKLDPSSAYVGLGEMERTNRELGQGLVGVGLELTLDDDAGELVVITPLPDMPAYKAGVRAGDRIVAIDGRPTRELTRRKGLETVVELLRGKAGDAVTVTIKRSGSDALQEIAIVRAPIQLETVKGDTRRPDGSWRLMLDDERKTGYVRLIQFGPQSAEELQAALNELRSQEMRGLLLDLRNNPGGSLAQAIRIADLFVESGIIVSVQGRDQPGQVWSAKEEGTFEDIPMAVLVNGGTAGAAEIVAACLQDQERAIVVGERTFGRGIAQSVFELEGAESALRLTTATFLRPSGKSLHRSPHAGESDDWGVVPDEGCQVKLSPEELVQYAQYRNRRDVFREEGPPRSDFEDRQLRKGLDCLRTLLETSEQL